MLVSERLGITVVVEGIETLEERDNLLALGIDLMQGYLFAKPVVGELQTMPQSLIASPPPRRDLGTEGQESNTINW